jgi:hypothetical protein
MRPRTAILESTDVQERIIETGARYRDQPDPTADRSIPPRVGRA